MDSEPPKTKSVKSNTYHAQALSRGLSILSWLGNRGRAATLAELRAETDLPKSTLTRLLAVMERDHFVTRSDDGPSYALGPAVVELAESYLSIADATALARPYLHDLAEELGLTTNLAILDSSHIVHVCTKEPSRALRYRASLIRDHAHGTALGKVLLAHLSPDRLSAHLPDEPYPARTEHTLRTFEELETQLVVVRSDGFAIDDEESDVGVRCIAAPLVSNSRCVAAVSASGPAAELSRDKLPDLKAHLSGTARKLAADRALLLALRQTSLQLNA